MARARNIKPGFFVNDELAEIEPVGRLLFIGLWTIADREGRLKDRPKMVKAQVLPYDNCDVNKLLDKLQDKGFILRYKHGGCQYIQIVNFNKHQNPHIKEQASEIPAPDMHHANTRQTPDENGTCPADSLLLIPDSLNPITSNVENPSSPKFGDDSPEMILSRYLFQKMRENDPKAKTPKLQSWAEHMDKLIRIDKRTEDEIRAVIDFCQSDPFWKSNIQSTNKLREKFSGLFIKMKEGTHGSNGLRGGMAGKAREGKSGRTEEDYRSGRYGEFFEK